MIWFARSKWVHKKNFLPGKSIAELVKRYVQEQIIISDKIKLDLSTSVAWKPLEFGFVKINFDAAFDHSQHRSASGLIARNANGRILASRSILHENMGTPFTA